MRATAIAVRQAQALETVNERLARIEAVLGIGDGEVPVMAVPAKLEQAEPVSTTILVQADDPAAVQQAIDALTQQLQERFSFLRIEVAPPVAETPATEGEAKSEASAETPAAASAPTGKGKSSK